MNPHVSESELLPWNEPAQILAALYRVGRETESQLQDAVIRLLEHTDSDIRAEALRTLLMKWKDSSVRSYARRALHSEEDEEVRVAAAFGLASISTEASRSEDTRLFLQVLLDDGQGLPVRSAVYDALLIIHRNPMFPTKKRDFDPTRDVDWEWVTKLSKTLGM